MLLFSIAKYPELKEITEEEATKLDGLCYLLTNISPKQSRRSFCVSHPSLLFLTYEDLELILASDKDYSMVVPLWIIDKIKNREVKSINTAYPNWKEELIHLYPRAWRIHIVGTGDVGGILATGFRLLGGTNVSSIGLYGNDKNSMKRWEYEINQILSPLGEDVYPEVTMVTDENLFDCDMFVFCASKGVPPLGHESKDVRLIQLEGNAKIISIYAKLARDAAYKGIFAVVSDPVDLLCKTAWLSSNQDYNGNLDFNGLAPDQIRGYGLGVMHARAAYYAKQSKETTHYLLEGRAFGPHGEGLIIADRIEGYNEERSLYLTEKAKKANLEIRETGFKPYIAPALSSGTLSLLATIKGQWHYSSTYMGGVFMGTRNRLIMSGTELEQFKLPSSLLNKLKHTYGELNRFSG